MTIEELIDSGKSFKNCGEWAIGNDDNKFVPEWTEEIPIERHIIYAFVISGNVEYIGKSDRTVSQRFISYSLNKGRIKAGKSRGSGIHLANAINTGKIVEIWIWIPEILINGTITIDNVDAGIEFHEAAQIGILRILEKECINLNGRGNNRPEWNGNP
ncbi:MAG: hypothetical protein K8R53_14675 [Bacteroidales bacterium]|nr:hypothetical protein [Bacteroidales bacterium]